ncbi:hypothetical protein BDF22DRAFT_5688 [Syncephalis plumigaleata]|nr:hypothetical protein BDF22DRAFT_5688 [Syncephalis plumigaleata]
MNAEDASDSDSAGEPLEGKNSRKTRGLINIRGGRSGHEHERGRRSRGRGGRGGDRGGGMVRDRRFNSDDDENWYVPGEPDTELPEDIAPLPVEPAASILSESISSTVYTSKPPKDTRPHHSSTSQRRPKRGKPTRSTMPLYSISATNDPVDEFEPRDTSGIHPNERQLFDPNTGTLQTAPKSATSHDHTAGHRRHRSAKSREIHTSKSATAHQSTPSMGVHDLIQQLQSMIVQLEKRMAITAREYDDSEITIDTSATTTTEADTVEYWRGRLDQCQSLLTCYTQWSKKYPTMDGIANAYGRIWKYGVYQCMDALRRRIKYKTQGVNDKEGKSTSSANQAITDNLRRLLNEHISMAEEFYQSTLSRLSAIFMTMSPNDMASSLVELGLWSCVMAMGDLSRYRGMFGLASGGEVDTLRRYWLKKSRAWYRWVTRFTPDNGKRGYLHDTNEARRE